MRCCFFFLATILVGCMPESAQPESSAGGSGGASQSSECELMPQGCGANPPTPAPPCAMAYPDASTRPWVCDGDAIPDGCMPTDVVIACPGESDRPLWCCP